MYTHLAVQLEFRNMAFDKIVCRPLDCRFDVCHLSNSIVRLTILHDAPRQHRCGISHGKIELHVVAGVKVSSTAINVLKWFALPL